MKLNLNEKYGPVWVVYIGWVEIEYHCPRHCCRGHWAFSYWQYGFRVLGLGIGLQ